MKMEALSVRDILSTQDIVIPEIQREYVWGNNKQLLEQFIRDITTAGTSVSCIPICRKRHHIPPVF